MSNFTNGSLVFRMWKDGSGEVLAKFQYFSMAKDWAKSEANRPDGNGMYYVAVCDAENKFQAYQTLWTKTIVIEETSE